jgi:transcriptional regulator with PAS, ATPase and Fis domain
MSDLAKIRPDAGLSTVSVRAAEVQVIAGPDAGRKMRVDGPTFTVGTGPDVHLRLSDEAVSREHFRLELEPDGVALRDSGSEHGTWLGGVRVERAVLATDTTLMIGQTTLQVILDRSATLLTISEATRFGDVLGYSRAMRHVFAYLEKVAATDVSLHLEGENGVGKEVLARAVHAKSSRAAGPFVAVDCGAIPPHLVESELFGHERGAFTGAHRAHVGLFEQANGGTLFLDEVGECPMDLQPKLLRALEQREVRPVGSTRARAVDIRVIAATNRNLVDRIAQGAFREDLFYRLAVARVRVPPLRDREEDIVPLALAFLRALRPGEEPHLPPDVVAMFRSYAWPGNVRELRNAVGRFALLGARERGDLLPVAERELASTDPRALSQMSFHDARRLVIERFEQGYFQAVLDRVEGNVSKAAEVAGVSRSTYYRMLGRTQRVNPQA